MKTGRFKVYQIIRTALSLSRFGLPSTHRLTKRGRVRTAPSATGSPNQVAPPGAGLPQTQYRSGQHVNDRAVAPAAQALTQLQRVAPIALLGRAMGLEPHLVA